MLLSLHTCDFHADPSCHAGQQTHSCLTMSLFQTVLSILNRDTRILFLSQSCNQSKQVSMTAHSSSRNHWVTENRARKDLEAACPSVVGQDQLLSVSFMVDLSCFLISSEQVSSLCSKTCRDRELGRQPIPCFSIDSTGKHFQCLI